MCCGPWGREELDMTEQLNWTEYEEGHQITEFHDIRESLSTWIIYNGQQAYLLFAPEVLRFYYTEQQTYLSFAPEGDIIPIFWGFTQDKNNNSTFQGCLPCNTFEKLMNNNGQTEPAPHSSKGHKCEKHVVWLIFNPENFH